METHEVLAAALAAVQQANIPEPLRSVAFSKAVDLIARPSGTAAPGTGSGQTGAQVGSGAAPESDRLKRIADSLGVPQDRIEMIYQEHEDALQVVADPDLLGSSTKERAKSVALLVAGGRQLGGWDEGPTGDGVIRTEVDRLGVYDGTNYSKHVRELSAWFNINGSARRASFRLKHAGRQNLKELASRLTTE
jgi:hypothetical protein